jgi:hypothetical protein
MLTQEISRREWRRFCDNLSRQRHGGSVTLEEIDSISGARMITWDLALEGIIADTRHTNRETLAIVVSENTDRHITHLISGPLAMQLQRTEGDTGDVLLIKSSNGTTTLLRFDPGKELPKATLEALIAQRIASYQKESEYGQM